MKNSQRLTAILLLAALASGLVSCANESDEPIGNTETTIAETTVPTTETTLEDVYPIPEITFDDIDFDIAILRTGYAGQDYNDLYAEVDSGDAVDAALFKRNSAVEERLRVKITGREFADATAEISKLAHADDDTYEMVQDRAVTIMPNLAQTGLLHDINDLPNMTIDAPWHNKKANESVTIGGKLFMLGSDATISDKQGLAALMFNKKLADDFDIPNLYELVNSGKWTLEKLEEYSTKTTDDISGDGKMDKSDRYGLIAEDFYGWFMLVTSGCKIAEKDQDDLPYFTAYTERAATVLDALQNFLYDENKRAGSNFEMEDYEKVFSEDRALFHANVLSTFALFRNMESDFGIIPLPKFDEAQEDYMTTISPYVSRFIAFPRNNSNTELMGTVADLLARYGTDTVVSAYYDVLLTGKLTRDTESDEMIEKIFAIATYDIGAIYNWGNCWFTYQQHFMAKKESFASTWQSISKAAEKQLEKAIEKFEGLE